MATPDYIVITPGLDPQYVSSMVDHGEVLEITGNDGTVYPLPVALVSEQRTVDASKLPPHVLTASNPPSPKIDGLAVWREALSATSVADMKLRAAKETLRQLEAQHFDASMQQAPLNHLEAHINNFQSEVKRLEKEALDGR